MTPLQIGIDIGIVLGLVTYARVIEPWLLRKLFDENGRFRWGRDHGQGKRPH